MSVPVRVAGSKAVHLKPYYSPLDAWRYIVGWTFCGMLPHSEYKDPPAGDLCSSCREWLDAICDLAYGGPPRKPK